MAQRPGPGRSTSPARVLLGVLVALLLLGGPAGVGSLGAAGAQEGPPGSGAELPEPGIIPEPDAGRPPEDAGDRGGTLQLAVLCAVLVAVAGGIAVVVRESRRARDRAAGRSTSG